MSARPVALPFESSSSLARAPFSAPAAHERPRPRVDIDEALEALESTSLSERFDALIRLGEALRDRRVHGSICPALLHRLESPILSKDERRATLWALSQAESHKLLSQFRRRLLSKDRRVAVDAAFFVGCARDSQSAAVLALTLLRHPVAEVARTVIWSLGTIGGEDAETTLLMIVDQRIYETECIAAMGICGGKESAKACAPYIADFDAGRRLHALHALAQIAEREGLEPDLRESLAPHVQRSSGAKDPTERNLAGALLRALH